MLTVTTEYLTTHYLDKVMVLTKAYIPADTTLEANTPVFLSMSDLKRVLPFINHENSEYQLSVNEDLQLVHLSHGNQLGEPMDVITGVECVCEHKPSEQLTLYPIDIPWEIIEPYDSALYTCATAVQIIKHLIHQSGTKTFAGASIESLDAWLPRSFKEKPFVKYDEQTLFETLQRFSPLYEALGYEDRKKLRDNYPFNSSFSQIREEYETKGNLSSFFV